MSFTSSFQSELDHIRAQRRYRRRRVVQAWVEGASGTVAIVNGLERTVFCSNDYLGLAHHPKVIEAFQQAARRDGIGSGASHLITGHAREHHALEEELATFTGRERALLFSTGYMANLGVVSALVGRGDVVLEDRLNHASLLDAGLLSGARLVRYPHADTRAVEKRLSRLRAADPRRRALVVTDGVFSMDGDVAPLAELARVALEMDAGLMVDDAHGIGVLGARGRGSLEAAGLDQEQAPVLMGTLGKALGSFGAFVAGPVGLIELLIQKARPYMYTTALPPGVAASARAALRLIDEEGWRREVLQKRVERFRRGAQQLGLRLGESKTAIQPLILGGEERALAASEALWERGLWVAAIRPPTVPDGSARLRITFSAAHTEEQVDRLIEGLSEVLRRLP